MHCCHQPTDLSFLLINKKLASLLCAFVFLCVFTYNCDSQVLRLTRALFVDIERTSMSRNTAPSQAQVEKLVGLLESRRWLATGHSRTANARHRSNQAWAEIATALNSEGSGCVKTWQQWSKYWKDKKGAIKRKTGAITAARRRTGGGIEDVAELTTMENRIVSLMGGESFATGDRHLEIDPFNDSTDAGSSDPSTSILQSSTLQEASLPADEIQQVEEYELQWNQPAITVLGEESVRDTEIQPLGPSQSEVAVVAEIHQTPGPSHVDDEDMDIIGDRGSDSTRRQGESVGREGSARRRIFEQSPASLHRRRRLPPHSPAAGSSAARRRLLRRSPPSQRRSEMASLTERFIAIEERRAEADLIVARAQEVSAQGQQNVAASVVQLAQAWAAHAQAINALVEAVVRNNNPIG